MPSPLQYAANRLNAEKSHGPTSPAGRVRSSMNALRHGLTARVVVLPSEDMAAYNEFSKEIVDSLDAQTPVERQFAQTVADNRWRINRVRSIEDGMLGMGHWEAAETSMPTTPRSTPPRPPPGPSATTPKPLVRPYPRDAERREALLVGAAPILERSP